MDDVQVFELNDDGTQGQPLFDAPAAPSAPVVSDHQAKMTSTLAAFANQMNAGADQAMSDTQALYEAQIKNGQETTLRVRVASDYNQQQMQALQDLQKNALAVHPEDYTLGDAVNAEVDLRGAAPNMSAVEENGTAVMKKTNATPDQTVLDSFLGGISRQQNTIAAKSAIFNAKLEALKAEGEGEGFFGHFGDFVGQFTGLSSYFGPASVGSAFSLPATNLNNARTELWSQTPDKFGATMDGMVESLKKRVGPAEAYRVLSEMGGSPVGAIGQSTASFNFWNTAPAASFLPVIKMSRWASGLARVVGNRALSSDIAANSIAGRSMGVKTDFDHIQPIETSIAETLPSAVIPDTVSMARGDVGVVSDVADKLEAMQIAANHVRATMQKTPRLAPNQIQEMLKKGIADAQLTYRDTPVADIKRNDPIQVEDIKPATPTIPETEPGDFSVSKTERQTEPSKTKEFVGVSNKGGPVGPKTQVPFDTGETIRDLGGDTFTHEQANLATKSSSYEAAPGISRKTFDPVYLDEFEELPALNKDGELRPATLFDTGEIPEGAKPTVKKKGPIGKLKVTSQSKVRFEIDDDVDIDSLSHFNARGEIYHDVPEATTFRTNPFRIADEVRDEVTTLIAQATYKAAQIKGGRLPNDFNPKLEIKTPQDVVDFFVKEHGLGSETLPSAPKNTPKFVVARKMPDGTVKIGKPGQMHYDLVSPEELEKRTGFVHLEDRQMGFADETGKFYTRKEAAAALGKNQDLESFTYQEAAGKKVETNDKNGNIKLVEGPRTFAPEKGELGGIRSIPEAVQSPSTGLYSLSFFIGKDQTAGGFLTREGAVAAAERRGMRGADVHQTLDGHWYIKVNHVMPETGLASKSVTAADYPAVYKPSEFVKSLDGLMPMLHNELRKGPVVGQSRWLKEVVGPYSKAIQTLNSRQNKALSTVLAAGEKAEKWFTMDELYDHYNTAVGRLPTNKEALAYYAAKELSDLNYHIVNDRLYTLAARRGMSTMRLTNPELGLDTGRVNARVISREEAKGQPIFILEDGSIEKGVRKNTELLLDTGHYKIVELQKPLRVENRWIKYAVSHDDSIAVEPLERNQLEYRPGGDREYADSWYVKQANFVVDDTGHKTWLDPHTHVTGPTKKSLKEWADGMETARLTYVSDKLSEAEKRLIIDRTPIESYDKFKKMVEEGTIHPEAPFEITYDNQRPSFMNRIGENDTNWTNPVLRSEESYYLTQGRMYETPKKEVLRDPKGNLAKVINPLMTLRRAVMNSSRTNALADYNSRVVEDWVKAASPYVDWRSVSKNPHPWEVFFNGKLLKSGLGVEDTRMVSSLDISRNAHKRFMNIRDTADKTRSMFMKNLAMQLETKGKYGEKLAAKIYHSNRLGEDPVSIARDLTFQTYFGFGNLKRFVLHASQAVGAIAYDPINGLAAAGMAPLTASAVWINRSDKWLDYVARKMGPEMGMAVKDYKEMVQSLRYSGWLHVSGEVAQLDRYSEGSWGGTYLSKGWDAVKKYGVVPFDTAIGLQRLMGYHMAWRDARALMPTENVWSPRFQSYVNNKADAISGNMTTASSAAWQKGMWAVPTQFMSWQARMIENLLPETFGGSKALSAQQKMRFALGQTLLWGAGGFPMLGYGYDVFSDMYKQNNGKAIDADTHRAISKGFVDSILHHFVGTDTDMSSDAGLGSAFNRTLEGFANGDMNPFLATLGGPIVETGNNVIDRLSHFVRYMKAEQIDHISPVEFEMAVPEVLTLIQGFKYDQRAYWAWKYHQLYDAKTDQPILTQGASNADAVMQALGVPNVWETAKPHYFQTEDDRRQTIDDVAKAVVKVRREEMDAIANNDRDRMDHYARIVKVLVEPYKDNPLMMQQIAQRSSQLMTSGYTKPQQEQIVNREFRETGVIPSEAE